MQAGDQSQAADLHVVQSLQVEPFEFLLPRLLSHKPRSQVVLCDYISDESSPFSECVVKVFPPKGRVAYEKELSAYSVLEKEHKSISPRNIWSGNWSAERYQEFLGGMLPSVLRRAETEVSVIALSFVKGSNVFSPRLPTETRIAAVKSALRSLRSLHRIGIVHGDISTENVIIRSAGDHFFAFWIDFSSCNISASKKAMLHEWEKANKYFSQTVRLYFWTQLTFSRCSWTCL